MAENPKNPHEPVLAFPTPPPNNPWIERVKRGFKKNWVQIRGNAKWDWLKWGRDMIPTIVTSIVGFFRYGPAPLLFLFLILATATVFIFGFFNSKLGKILGVLMGIGALLVLGIGCHKYEHKRDQQALLRNEIPITSNSVNIGSISTQGGGPANVVAGSGNSIYNASGGNNQIGGSGNAQNNFNNCTINYIYATQTRTQFVNIFRTNYVSGGTISPQLIILTNNLVLAGQYLISSNFEIAYEHANEAIQMLEESNVNFGMQIPPSVKASAYGLAALSIDAQDTDPQLAYALAEKAYAFGQDDYTHSFIAITSHNLATFYAKKGDFENGLGFENQAISIYEKIPSLLDSNLPPNSASEYYQNRAFFYFKLGFLEQATSDSLFACAKNHNRRNIQLLNSILLERGYRAEKCYVWTNKILVLTTNANGTESGMEHGFAYPDSIIKQIQNYH